MDLVLRTAKGCLECGLHVVKNSSDAWMEYARSKAPFCDRCHGTDFDIKQKPRAEPGSVTIQLGGKEITLPFGGTETEPLYEFQCKKCHDISYRTALSEVEKFAETRIRRDGADSERVTGKILTAAFRHETSRELDPHLHTHCITFNATFDSVEQRWKALHASGMYRAQKFAENLYFHELAKGLRSLGYQIKNNARNFELAGVPQSIIDRLLRIYAESRDRAQAVLPLGP